MTPASVHFGHAAAIEARRRRVLEAAYVAHPERFKGRLPTPPPLPEIVDINLPKIQSTETTNDLIAPPTLLSCSLIPRTRCLKVIDTFRRPARHPMWRTGLESHSSNGVEG